MSILESKRVMTDDLYANVTFYPLGYGGRLFMKVLP